MSRVSLAKSSRASQATRNSNILSSQKQSKIKYNKWIIPALCIVSIVILYLIFKHNKNISKNTNPNYTKEKFETLTVNSNTYTILNPPESSRRASDWYDLNDKPNYPSQGYYDENTRPLAYPNVYDHLSSMLDTKQGLSFKDNKILNNNKWLEIYLGDSAINIAGVVTQGRGPGITKSIDDKNSFGGQSVTSYTVAYSSDRTNWTPIVDNSNNIIKFKGNTTNVYKTGTDNNFKIGNVFPNQISTRYIRIYPTEFINFPSLRAGLLINTPSTTTTTTTTLPATVPTTTTTILQNLAMSASSSAVNVNRVASTSASTSNSPTITDPKPTLPTVLLPGIIYSISNGPILKNEKNTFVLNFTSTDLQICNLNTKNCNTSIYNNPNKNNSFLTIDEFNNIKLYDTTANKNNPTNPIFTTHFNSLFSINATTTSTTTSNTSTTKYN